MAEEQLDIDHVDRSVELDEFLIHLAPVVEAMGGRLVAGEVAESNDIAVLWRAAVVSYVRGPELHGALGRLVTIVERETGRGLDAMNRSEKQAAVRRLDELGAFLLRGAVENIAQLMGVSRVTLYSYLNAIRPKG